MSASRSQGELARRWRELTRIAAGHLRLHYIKKVVGHRGSVRRYIAISQHNRFAFHSKSPKQRPSVDGRVTVIMPY